MNENATTQTTTTLTKEQELLRAFRSPEDLKAFINCIQNDEEYQAWKAAHPERDSKWQSMTRDEQTEDIISSLAQLGLIEEETPEEKAARQAYREIRQAYREIDKLLDHQCTSRELGYFYHNYIAHKKASNYDECLLIMDIFNYGKICGKREERARRKREQV